MTADPAGWPDWHARFWAKVDRRGPDECWPWRGATDGRYGQFHRLGRCAKAHRISWEIANGVSFPRGMNACHACDNTRCVNPRHIWPGTQSDNLADAGRKRRIPHPGKFGVDTPSAKLSPDQAAAIRLDPRSSYSVAKDYDVNPTTVQRIRRGEHWSVAIDRARSEGKG